MKLEIPIIVGFDDMESLLDDLKKLQTYKLFEGDEMVLVDIEDVAKVLMDHVKAKKSVKGDLVSRKSAQDALECMRFASDAERRYGFSLLEQIPTAQPEVGTQMSLADCISRQSAIDAIDEQIRQCDKALSAFDISMKDAYAVKVERASLVAFRETLEYVPTAQPEHIVQCNFCNMSICTLKDRPCSRKVVK